MKILIAVVFILLIDLQAKACSSCVVGKDMAKCDYYVKKEHNLKYQSNCIAYAKAIDQDGMFAKASWYYLLGGDKDMAKSSAMKALKIGQHYAAEYMGFVYILENDKKHAEDELKFFKQKVKDVKFAKKDIKNMKSIYKNFDDKFSYQILYKK